MRWWVPALLLAIALTVPYIGNARGSGGAYLKFERQADGTWLGSGSASERDNLPGTFWVNIAISSRFNQTGSDFTFHTGKQSWEYPLGLSQRQVNKVAAEELGRKGGPRARTAALERMRNSSGTVFGYSTGAPWAAPLVGIGLVSALGVALLLGAIRLVERVRQSRRVARAGAGLCPRCRYPIDGLDAPNCPECWVHVQQALRFARRRLGMAANET